MNTLNFEAEPFEMEAGAEEFGHEEAGSDFESYEGTEDFERETTPTPGTQTPNLSSQSAQVHQGLHRRRGTHAKLVTSIGALNKYVVKRNGIYQFTLPARDMAEVASKLGIDPRMTSMLLQSLKKKNTRLRAARVTQSELELEAPCAGRSALETYWWGTQIWLDECQTKTLISGLKAGAAGGGGCAALVPHPYVKAACAALGAVSGVSAYGLEAIDSAGGNQGLIVYVPWVGGAWPWHQ